MPVTHHEIGFRSYVAYHLPVFTITAPIGIEFLPIAHYLGAELNHIYHFLKIEVVGHLGGSVG